MHGRGWLGFCVRPARPSQGSRRTGGRKGGGAFKNSHPILSGEETWSHSWHISSSSCHAACKTILDEEGGRLVAPRGDSGVWTGGERWGHGTPGTPPASLQMCSQRGAGSWVRGWFAHRELLLGIRPQLGHERPPRAAPARGTATWSRAAPAPSPPKAHGPPHGTVPPSRTPCAFLPCKHHRCHVPGERLAPCTGNSLNSQINTRNGFPKVMGMQKNGD